MTATDINNDQTHRETSRIGVLLVNTGTPHDPSLKAIRNYLNKFLMDPRIRPMNTFFWWLLLHIHILRVRPQRSVDKYQQLWTDNGFSFNENHKKLSEGLQSYYKEINKNVLVRYAMSYGEPTIDDALIDLLDNGCESLVILPLYPQSAYSTTGAVRDGVGRALNKLQWKGNAEFIDNYHDDVVYIRAIAASIKNAGFDPSSDDKLFFSYHSIPLADIEAGDTYELQVGATSMAIANELDLERSRWTIGYQCRFDSGRSWLSPFTRQTLESWAESGMNERIFMVCPNFSVDCLETSFEVVYEIKPEFLEKKHRWENPQLQTVRYQDLRKEGSESKKVSSSKSKDSKDSFLSHAYGNFDGSQRGITVDQSLADSDDEFVYVPCLNKSKAHLKVLEHVLAPYLENENNNV